MTGQHRSRGHLPVRHHLLLDAAALLGPRAHQAGRLRQGRHPDDAGGAGRGAHQVRDAGLHADPAPAHDHARVLRRARACSTAWRPRCWAPGSSGTASGFGASASVTPVAWRMYRYSLLYLALLFVAMGVDRALPFGHRPAPTKVLILEQAGADQAIPAARPPRTIDRSPARARTEALAADRPSAGFPPPGRLVRLWPRVRPYRGILLLATPRAASAAARSASPSRWCAYLLDAAFVNHDRRAPGPDRARAGGASSRVQAVLNYAQAYLLSAAGERVGGRTPARPLRPAAPDAARASSPSGAPASSPAGSRSTSACCRVS